MDKQYQPTLTEVQDWVLKLYNTCEQTITKAERLEQHNMPSWCSARKTRNSS